MGYDILSYDDIGKPRFLEVKTTTGTEKTPFYLSENEKAFIEEYGEEVEIVRVYNFDDSVGTGDIFRISGKDFLGKVHLQPLTYKVTFLR